MSVAMGFLCEDTSVHDLERTIKQSGALEEAIHHPDRIEYVFDDSSIVIMRDADEDGAVDDEDLRPTYTIGSPT